MFLATISSTVRSAPNADNDTNSAAAMVMRVRLRMVSPCLDELVRGIVRGERGPGFGVRDTGFFAWTKRPGSRAPFPGSRLLSELGQCAQKPLHQRPVPLRPGAFAEAG